MLYMIGFSRKSHFFARAIRWFTASEFSHTYIRQIGHGCDYVLEANHRGVNIQAYSVFLRDGASNIEEFRVMTDGLDEAWGRTLIRRLNRRYSYMQIIGDAIVIALGRAGIRTRNPFAEPRRDVCSELVLAWLRAADAPGLDGLELATVTPEALYRCALAQPDTYRPAGSGHVM